MINYNTVIIMSILTYSVYFLEKFWRSGIFVLSRKIKKFSWNFRIREIKKKIFLWILDILLLRYSSILSRERKYLIYNILIKKFPCQILFSFNRRFFRFSVVDVLLRKN